MKKKLLYGGLFCLGIGGLLLFISVLTHAYRLDEVKVTLLEGQEEPHDITLPLDKEAAPDYRLFLHYTSGWVDCGTFQDTPMKSGLTWKVPEDSPPASFLVEYKLVESDRALDDILDQVPSKGDRAQGNQFAFERTIVYSSAAGWAWFFAHPLGKAIITIVVLAVIAVVLSLLPL